MDGEILLAAEAGVVALVAAVVAVAAWQTMLRTGNRGIGLVVIAFSLMALKSLAKALIVATGNEGILPEAVFSGLDVASVVLIAVPIVRRPRG